jgi:cytochrome P450
MMVIAEMIGIPVADWPQFRRWSDLMLKLSYSMRGMEREAAAADALTGFRKASMEMDAYLAGMIAERKERPREDLLTRLIEAEVDGEHLEHKEILGFFQLLVVAGQETTTNLINNAVISLIENAEQLARLRAAPELASSAVEEVLRHRSPLQWVMRAPRHDTTLNGREIPAGKLVLAMLGSANRDGRQFPNPDQFDIQRTPNAHVAFGHGIHSCIGAALSRMEARVALNDLLPRMAKIEFASNEPWQPRQALHVHGPAQLPIRWQ